MSATFVSHLHNERVTPHAYMYSKFAPATCGFLLLIGAFIYIVAPKKAGFLFGILYHLIFRFLLNKQALLRPYLLYR